MILRIRVRECEPINFEREETFEVNIYRRKQVIYQIKLFKRLGVGIMQIGKTFVIR